MEFGSLFILQHLQNKRLCKDCSMIRAIGFAIGKGAGSNITLTI